MGSCPLEKAMSAFDQLLQLLGEPGDRRAIYNAISETGYVSLFANPTILPSSS